MANSIGTTSVQDVMNCAVFCVGPTDKIEDVAKLFEAHDVNAAPVVDGLNVCVGIITSHDLVEYEAARSQMEHGMCYDLGHYGSDEAFSIIGQPFDEVAHHMSTNVVHVPTDWPVSKAAKLMCEKHVHHLLALDQYKHPVGIISTLDILGEIIGVAVIRPERTQED